MPRAVHPRTWMGRQTSWTSLDWVWPGTPQSRGYWVAESVGESIPLAVGAQAGSLCHLSSAPGNGEVGGDSPFPATCLLPGPRLTRAGARGTERVWTGFENKALSLPLRSDGGVQNTGAAGAD